MPGSVTIPAGAAPTPHELATAYGLSAVGHRVRFLVPSRELGARTPDAVIDEALAWEFKGPRGSSVKNTIADQFKRGRRQSENLVVDLARCGLSDDLAISQIRRRFYGRSELARLIILDKERTVTYLVRSGSVSGGR